MTHIQVRGIVMEAIDEKKMYTLQEVTFEYLKNKCHREDYRDRTFDEIINSTDLNSATGFSSSYETFSKDWKNILKTLKIRDEIESCKHPNGGYTFDEDDKDFLCELMYRYKLTKAAASDREDDTKIKIWTAIRHIDNTNYDGFIELYKKVGTALVDEVKFINEGFLSIYKKKEGEESKRYGEFERHLDASTQYIRLSWMKSMETIIGAALPISQDEVEATIGEELIIEHMLRLQYMMELISTIVKIENTLWEEQKLQKIIDTQKKYDKFKEYEKLEKKLQEIDNEIEEKYGIFCKSPKKDSDIKDVKISDTIQKRIENREENSARKQIKKIIENLPDDQKAAIQALYENNEPTRHEQHSEAFVNLVNMEF